MANSERFIRRTHGHALELAWDMLGPGPEARDYVDSFFERFRADLIRWHNEYAEGKLSSEELSELIDGLHSQADAFLPVLTELQLRNFHRRFTGNLVNSLTGEDDEDPGPQVAR